MSATQPSHAKWKTPLVMLEGFKLAKTSAEKSVRDAHPYQATAAARALGNCVSKEVRAVLRQDCSACKTSGKIDTLNCVSEPQYCHEYLQSVADGSVVLKEVIADDAKA